MKKMIVISILSGATIGVLAYTYNKLKKIRKKVSSFDTDNPCENLDVYDDGEYCEPSPIVKQSEQLETNKVIDIEDTLLSSEAVEKKEKEKEK